MSKRYKIAYWNSPIMKDFLWTSPAFFISMRHVRPNSLFHRSCDSFRYSRSERVTSPLKQAAFYQNPFWGRLKLICRLENGLLMELKTQTNLNESLSWFPGPPVRFLWSEFFGLWTGPARIADYGPDGKNKDQSPVRAAMVIGRCPSESMSSFNQFT